jgi:hypothetical protein
MRVIEPTCKSAGIDVIGAVASDASPNTVIFRWLPRPVMCST